MRASELIAFGKAMSDRGIDFGYHVTVTDVDGSTYSRYYASNDQAWVIDDFIRLIDVEANKVEIVRIYAAD